MPRRCTVCDAPARAEIDRLLVGRAAPFRDIARRFRLSKDALYRHYAEHLPAALVRSEEAREAVRSVDLMAELEGCVTRVRLLFDACDAWLRDADDPTRYDIGPRAADVAVTYVERTDDGKAVRRKAKLSELLDRVAGVAPDVRLVETKHADPRELVLHAAKRLDGHLTLFGQLVGKLQSGMTVNVLVTPEWRAVQAALLEALAPFPDARLRAADALARLERAPAGSLSAGGLTPGGKGRALVS